MAETKAKHYFGEFNENGYSIFCDSQHEDAIYQAGNCQYDSSQYLPIGSKGSIDIATIEAYCDQTGKEIAKENSGIWDGCSKIDNFES